MKCTPIRFGAKFLLVCLVLSCDNESDVNIFADCSADGPDFTISEISGNWRASEAVVQTIPPGSTKDIVAAGGAVQLFVDDIGGFTLLVRESNRKSKDFTGMFSFCSDKLYAIYDYETEKYDAFDAVYENDQLFYYGPMFYDYDGDGVDENVSIAFTFNRE
jgi:hypothetical protein